MDEDGLTLRTGPSARVLRDVAAVVLIILGAAGLVACAFVQDRLLGFTTLSVVALAFGIALGYSAERDSADDY